MATVINEETSKLTAPVVYLVDTSATDPEAIALIERGSISNSLNESNNSFEAHSQTDNIVNRTTQEGELTMTVARVVDDDALEKLGVRDDLNEGAYIRDSGREFAELELWKFESDVSPPEESSVTHRDRIENPRVDVGSLDLGDETETFELTIHYEAIDNLYLGYEPST